MSSAFLRIPICLGMEVEERELHPQVRTWLTEVGLLGRQRRPHDQAQDEVGLVRRLLAAGYGHSPAAFGQLSLPHFHSVLGLEDFHARRRLHALLLRLNGRIPAARSTTFPSSATLPPSSSSRRPSPSTRQAPWASPAHGLQTGDDALDWGCSFRNCCSMPMAMWLTMLM